MAQTCAPLAAATASQGAAVTASVGTPTARGGCGNPSPIPLSALSPMRTPVKLPGPVVAASARICAGVRSSWVNQRCASASSSCVWRRRACQVASAKSVRLSRSYNATDAADVAVSSASSTVNHPDGLW